MIDDSICYLIHDMIGLDYKTIDMSEPEQHNPPMGADLEDWYGCQTSIASALDWAIEDLANIDTDEWRTNLSSASVSRPRTLSGHCACDAHTEIVDNEDVRVDPCFMHELRLSIGSSTMRFVTKSYDLAVDLDEEIRLQLRDREHSYSEALNRQRMVDPGLFMGNTMEFTYPTFSSFGVVRESELYIQVPEEVFVYLIDDNGCGIPLTGKGRSIVSQWVVDSECINEPSTVTTELSSSRSNYVYATQMKLEFYESLSYSSRWNRIAGRYAILGGLTYVDLYEQYLEFFERTQEMPSRNNLVDILNLTRIRHTVRSCTICQERMEFTPREAADSIRELVRT